MTRKIEEVPVGYPGFLVMRPPRISSATATLKRVALAKLVDIRLMSATFGGETILFEPWLTLLVDYGRGAFLAGVYRTDSASDEDADRDGSGSPIWCLRKSEWDREEDLERSRDVLDLGEYLRSGPQVTSKLVFANRATHPEVDSMMHTALVTLRPGIRLTPVERRPSEWQFVDFDLADEGLTCRMEYSPLIARSETLESVLPSWLSKLDELICRGGFLPDGEVTVSIRRSVPELTGA